MKDVLHHKGYQAALHYSEADECFVGEIVGISDVVTFHGDSVAELKAAFVEAVEDYIETCEKVGKKPQKTFSGKMMLRVRPEVHAAASVCARLRGRSLNQWADELMAREVGLEVASAKELQD